MSWQHQRSRGDEKIKDWGEDEGAQLGNVLYFARHRVRRMCRVNEWSLHANIGTVLLERVT